MEGMNDCSCPLLINYGESICKFCENNKKKETKITTSTEGTDGTKLS